MFCVSYTDEGLHRDKTRTETLAQARMYLLETVYALDRYGAHTGGAAIWVNRCDASRCDGEHGYPDKAFSLGKRGGVVKVHV